MTDSAPKATPQKQENAFLNLGMNLVLPVLLLNKGDDWFNASPTAVLIIALVFPLGYGIYDFVTRKKANLFSIIGFVSVLLTGGIGLLHLDNKWLAVKEAGIPAIFAIITGASALTKKPLVRLFILNREIMDVDRIDAAIPEGDRGEFDKVLARGTWYLAASFVVSSILNYILTTIIVVSEPGTDAYNSELGKLQAMSFAVIALPSILMLGYAMWYVFTNIKKITGLGFEDLMYQPAQPKKKNTPS
ncbi:MAG: hypothetical protein MK080_13680 [Opitutales bacterium]|nr:hypothetical protein [Opitutales bacterium]NRA26310.1 MFS transporter [Opitutales bacterium]